MTYRPYFGSRPSSSWNQGQYSTKVVLCERNYLSSWMTRLHCANYSNRSIVPRKIRDADQTPARRSIPLSCPCSLFSLSLSLSLFATIVGCQSLGPRRGNYLNRLQLSSSIFLSHLNCSSIVPFFVYPPPPHFLPFFLVVKGRDRIASGACVRSTGSIFYSRTRSIAKRVNYRACARAAAIQFLLSSCPSGRIARSEALSSDLIKISAAA